MRVVRRRRAAHSLPALPLAALLVTPLLGAPALAKSEDASTLEVAEVVLNDGCRPKLLRTDKHRFIEAQIACDAFLSYALVNEVLDGQARPEREEKLAELLEDALDRARKPFLRDGTDKIDGRAIPKSVLYRGYLLLMLAGQEKVGLLSDEQRALFDALATEVATDLDEDPLLPSFGRAIWPCDNAVAASALTLHGRLRDDERTLAAGDQLAGYLDSLRQSPSGFPTKVNAEGEVLEEMPRGTVLAWTAAFLAMGDRPEAKAFAGDLVEGFCSPVPLLGAGVGACREWPRGVEKEPDGVSGPIVQGFGVGASTLALAATTGAGSSSWPRRLLALAERFGILDLRAAPQEYPLENAIFLWGRGLKRW